MATCKEPGCEAPVNARGWCNKHYTRWKRYGDANPPRKAKLRNGSWPKMCAFCDNPSHTLGLCTAHYQRKLNGADMNAPLRSWGDCVVCQHPELEEIEERMRHRRYGTLTSMASEMGIDRPVLEYHLNRHLDNEQYQSRIAAREVRRLAAIRSWGP